MTPENFVYWLNGFVELTETRTISEKQWQAIKDHLSMVLEKKTPVIPVGPLTLPRVDAPWVGPYPSQPGVLYKSEDTKIVAEETKRDLVHRVRGSGITC